MILKKLITIIKIYLRGNDTNLGDKTRTKMILKSTLVSFISRGLAMVIAIITLPIVYNYLDKYQYGVYATLTSIIVWIDLFDFGIAQGLRNRLTEAYTHGKIELSRIYISTSYFILTLISISFIIIYLLLFKVLNWSIILNAKEINLKELNLLALIVFSSFSIRFTASIINKIFFALQKSYWVDISGLIGKIVYLFAILYLKYSSQISLLSVGAVQSSISALTPIIASLVFFIFSKYKLVPKIKFIDVIYIPDILSLGFKFFFIQLSLLVINSSNNILISQFVNPSSVAYYSLAFSLFSYFTLAYSILITPLWSAYTEAWQLGRIEWIKNTLKKIRQLFLLMLIGAVLVVIISPFFFKIWIGAKADVPLLMTFCVAIMVLLDMWIRIYDFFINGVGKIRLQTIITVCMAIINIPLAYLLAVVLNLGAIGVVLASIAAYTISAIFSPIQAYRILNVTAKGVWNK